MVLSLSLSLSQSMSLSLSDHCGKWWQREESVTWWETGFLDVARVHKVPCQETNDPPIGCQRLSLQENWDQFRNFIGAASSFSQKGGWDLKSLCGKGNSNTVDKESLKTSLKKHCNYFDQSICSEHVYIGWSLDPDLKVFFPDRFFEFSTKGCLWQCL